MGDLPSVHIEAMTQMRVFVERSPPALVGERQDENVVALLKANVEVRYGARYFPQ